MSHELIQNSIESTGTVNFADLDSVFNLIVKPVSLILSQWQQKKDPDTLDVFFLKTIELFQEAETNSLGSLKIRAQLMCIDVHKLRILTLGNEGTVNFALEYIETCLAESYSDGRLWFQHAIMKFSFLPNSYPIKDFQSIDSICRSILARDNPVDPKNILILLDRKVNVDFSNTLLNLALSDFKDFVEKDLETWSFVKYFQSFLAGGNEKWKLSELAAIFLFVLAFFKISKNSFHFKMFLETSLTAANQSISDFWPFFLFSTFKLVEAGELELSDAIWFKIFQLLKGETVIITSIGLNNANNIANITNITSYANFDEEFSIERDSIVNSLVEYFDHETGPFRHFITLRSDRSLRLGSHFCQQETESEDENEAALMDTKTKGYDTTDHLETSIKELKSKLATLTTNSRPTTVREIDYLSSHFILDTNVLLSGNQQLINELLNRPELFLIPLVVVSEISGLRESTEKASYALAAWDLIINNTEVQIYNNNGWLLRPEEVPQQLSILQLTRSHALNDDQIIDLAFQFPELEDLPILITEDLNMRLVAKSKKVYAISLDRFQKLCLGGT